MVDGVLTAADHGFATHLVEEGAGSRMGGCFVFRGIDVHLRPGEVGQAAAVGKTRWNRLKPRGGKA
jgi:hypothetical protein